MSKKRGCQLPPLGTSPTSVRLLNNITRRAVLFSSWRKHYIQSLCMAEARWTLLIQSEWGKNAVQAYLVFSASLYCAQTVLCFSMNLGFVATLHQAIHQCHFSTAFTTHIVSLCHILVILAIFQSSSLLLDFFLWWTLISNLWGYYCNYFEEPWTTPRKWT